MPENRDLDKKIQLVPPKKRIGVSKDVLKSAYLTKTITLEELANSYMLPVSQVEEMAVSENWDNLKKEYIVRGIEKVQNIQIDQAHKLIDIETKFKALRIAQLETMLSEYLAYYARYGDLKKRHSISGEIIQDLDGLDVYLDIPNVSKELQDLKASVNVGEGTKKLVDQLEKLVSSINPNDEEKPNTINVDAYSKLFEGVGDKEPNK